MPSHATKPTATTKQRQELRSSFVRNATPRQEDFADLIAAGLNQADDGLLKLADQSLALVRQEQEAPLLRLFAAPEAEGAAWQLQLGAGDQPSLSLLGADGKAALIVDGATAPLADAPEAATPSARPKLEVKGSLRCDAISGPVNLINKAHFSLKGGGTISWSETNHLTWTRRFRADGFGVTSFSRDGYFNITHPTSTESGNLESWDGENRIDDAGIKLCGWESLYAILTGAGSNDVRLRIVDFSRQGEVPSNWLLIASRNGDDQTLKLGTGLTLSPGQSVCHGSPIACGTIIMWHGKAEDIPAGWLVCDGTQQTPDLRGRFILGSGQGTDPSVRDPQQPKGGSESVTLSVNEMPKHKHNINDPGHFSHSSPRYHGNITCEYYEGQKRYSRNHSFTDQATTKTGITIQETGLGEPFDIMPPFYILVFLMKSFD
jgi:microcystin-dependent protein